MSFKLTYSTMFDPPAEMHERFEAALGKVRASLPVRQGLYIGGRDVAGHGTNRNVSPIDGTLLGEFGTADRGQVAAAVAAAKLAFPAWRATPLAERVRLAKRVAALIDERVYEIAAAVSLEVGKNRMEALGEVAEVAEFFNCYADEFARNDGYDHALPDDPVQGFRSRNRSVLKPHGVWGVIAPFNFPMALAGGPSAAALVTGNTVVVKGATDTPWAVRLLADCVRDAGYPPGVFNLIAGSGSEAGEALVGHPDLAGITFTGSYAVGMDLCRRMVAGAYARPCIAEMGGKNAVIVTAAADLERAVAGVVRSGFGMGGQKCSATSRVYVADEVAAPFLAKLEAAMQALTIGDPTERRNWLGPVINARAVENYERYCAGLARDGGQVLAGGRRLGEGALAAGCFVAPTLATAPAEHPLFAEEMFLPIVMVARTASLEEAIAHANRLPLGLTAGFYGNAAESRQFLEQIEAGTTYVNRPQGATTGAWPGYQAFGGWKGSGSTNKAIGSAYYLPQYLREQSQTVVE
jgi:1-pyrroline-5-carboxylate dehydrogenase